MVADFTKFEQNRILIGTSVIRHRALTDKRVTLGYPDASSFVSFRSLQILHAGVRPFDARFNSIIGELIGDHMALRVLHREQYRHFLAIREQVKHLSHQVTGERIELWRHPFFSLHHEPHSLNSAPYRNPDRLS